MTMRKALLAALVSATPVITAADTTQEDIESDDAPSSLPVAVVPVLIVVSTLVLSLEIMDQSRVSRPLSAVGLVFLWTALLRDELQTISLLAGGVYHCIEEGYTEWESGFPCLFQPIGANTRKLRLWMLFWMRVFAWGATSACASALYSTPIVNQSIAEIAGAALFFAVYCESAELLLLFYYSCSPVLYNWRARVRLWTAALCLGALYRTRVLLAWSSWIQSMARPTTVVVLLVLLQWITGSVDWSSAVASTQRRCHALVTMVWSRGSKAATATHSTRRRRFLYRADSDVEVVAMASHYEAYDFRHKHDDATATSPA